LKPSLLQPGGGPALWLFIVAPLLGGATAAAVYRTVHRPVAPIAARDAERALESERIERQATQRPTQTPV
jgi:aquaporin Z